MARPRRVLPPVIPGLGLALGGGAALGWAHIGVIRSLIEDCDIRPAAVAGTSIGAIVGAAYATGKLGLVEDVARALRLKDMLVMGQVGFGKGAALGTGRIENLLRQHFGHTLMEELETPFAAVATDLNSGMGVVLKTGPLVDAVKASSAIPGLFPAVDIRGHALVDGGVVEPVPVEAVRSFGTRRVIAVNLQGDYTGALRRIKFTERRRPSMMKTARAAVSLGLKTIATESLRASRPDLVITPKVGHMDVKDFTKAAPLIELGRAAAREMRDEILALVQAAA